MTSSSSGIIIEGLTGAGKSSTLKVLLSNDGFINGRQSCDIFREKETFGNFMGELLEDPSGPPEPNYALLPRNRSRGVRATAESPILTL